MFGSEMEPLGQTWIEISGEACGAQANELGPIGGGEGYTNVVSPTGGVVSTPGRTVGGAGAGQTGGRGLR